MSDWNQNFNRKPHNQGHMFNQPNSNRMGGNQNNPMSNLMQNSLGISNMAGNQTGMRDESNNMNSYGMNMQGMRQNQM